MSKIDEFIEEVRQFSLANPNDIQPMAVIGALHSAHYKTMNSNLSESERIIYIINSMLNDLQGFWFTDIRNELHRLMKKYDF
jgi:hypothetical protein